MKNLTIESIRAWVNQVENDEDAYETRKSMAVILLAVSLDEDLAEKFVLKGGFLMTINFQSTRFTSDVDFSYDTVNKNPKEIKEDINKLDNLMRRAQAKLGYGNRMMIVQTIHKNPKFEDHEFEKYTQPSMIINIGIGNPNSAKDRKKLANKKLDNVNKIDLSLKETLVSTETILIEEDGAHIRVYSSEEIVAEKLRALIEPVSGGREKSRRQDVYDIWYLISINAIKRQNYANILKILQAKCKKKHKPILLNSKTFENPKIKSLAERDWLTLKLENEDLPDFNECFNITKKLYEDLPW